MPSLTQANRPALTNANFLSFQEDSKIFRSAKEMEKFLEEQLTKWLPDYAGRKRNTPAPNTDQPSKRQRTGDESIRQILDDDDDVVMAYWSTTQLLIIIRLDYNYYFKLNDLTWLARFVPAVTSEE